MNNEDLVNLDKLLDWEVIGIEFKMLMAGKLKLQTLHNQSCTARKNGDLKTYMEKCIVKSYFNFTNKRGTF